MNILWFFCSFNYRCKVTIKGVSNIIGIQGWIQRFLKGHHDWLMKKILGLRWSKKAKITLQTKAFGETFQYFQIFFIFIYNESLPVKSYQFFKIYKRFYKKEKNSHTAVNEQRKNERSCTLFYLTGYFMKPLKIVLNHFFFNRSFCSQDCFYFASLFTAQFLFFDVTMMQEISKGEIGNEK